MTELVNSHCHKSCHKELSLAADRQYKYPHGERVQSNNFFPTILTNPRQPIFLNVIPFRPNINLEAACQIACF